MSVTPPEPGGTRFRPGGALVTGAIFAGAGLISYGAWLIYHPAAFIVGGGFLLCGGWMFASRGV